MNISPRLFVVTQTLYSLILVETNNNKVNSSNSKPIYPIGWNKDLAKKAYEMAGWLLECETEAIQDPKEQERVRAYVESQQYITDAPGEGEFTPEMIAQMINTQTPVSEAQQQELDGCDKSSGVNPVVIN